MRVKSEPGALILRLTHMDARLTPRIIGLVSILAAVLLAGTVIALAVMATRPATAAASTVAPTDGSPAPGISVTGSARVEGVPDTLRLDIGVNTVDTSVDAALTAANTASAALQKSLRDNGVAERDIASTQLSIQPQYNYNRSTPTITGYQVTQSVTAKVRDLDTAGQVIGAAAAAGGDATVVNGIAFDLEDNAALLSDARERAVADAKAKAEEYARATGRGLGQVVSLVESTVDAPRPFAYEAAEDSMAAGGADVPLAPGTQTVSVRVQVTYAFR